MRSPIDNYLADLHADLLGLDTGVPFQGIPAMKDADNSKFAIAIATVDGHVYQVGDAELEFSIQSISKPFSYALALDDMGLEIMDEKVDVEPSGDAFNEISLARDSGRPANAMINAGAIATISMIRDRDTGRFERLLEHFSAAAGRSLEVSESIYASEALTGHRNRALAYMLRSFDIIETDPTPVLEDYFRACSVMVNTRDLAMMAATLANGGTQPITGTQVMGQEAVQRTLSVMTTCGMYDDAGSWIAAVGLPAKSGVGGGLIAVLPGQLGLAIYSPALNPHGSSVRGVEASERISADMGLHFVRAARLGRSVIRENYSIAEVPTHIRHTDAAEKLLAEYGECARIIELAGDLLFAGTESLVREVSSLDNDVELVILDLRRVDEIDKIAVRLIHQLARELSDESRTLALVQELAFEELSSLRSFPSRNEAIEWAQSTLLARHGSPDMVPETVAVRDFSALAPLDASDIAKLESLMEESQIEDGRILRRPGQEFGGVYFILGGKVATSTLESGKAVRRATLSAGMTFGEIALSAEGEQITRVTALGKLHLKVLSAASITQLEAEDPAAALRFWKALARDAYTRVEANIKDSTHPLN
ncbi:glutaminase A [Paeniglutamicibacter gangotriensis]|uniref:Glutaminase n=2 Tax=Paeniglutamicibacter gangotriensis TaxID=254787 RepID=M7MNH7_9MICC|nr:glutaminase A [Paeniglutamicibacter gangotriensis]EMQ97907.1 glutaminase [Paeniglutamicibacter gangotriensis Lz1y]KAA0978919.1 glutaminase A [Paeniglutamicibacter gangotriensis]